MLSTSYFLVRSSPRLNERLLASRTFGGLLRDWQQHGGMRRRVKIKAVAVVLVVATLTILTAQLSVVMLVVVLLLMAVGIWMVVRTPTISDAACPVVRHLTSLPCAFAVGLGAPALTAPTGRPSGGTPPFFLGRVVTLASRTW